MINKYVKISKKKLSTQNTEQQENSSEQTVPSRTRPTLNSMGLFNVDFTHEQNDIEMSFSPEDEEAIESTNNDSPQRSFNRTL